MKANIHKQTKVKTQTDIFLSSNVFNLCKICSLPTLHNKDYTEKSQNLYLTN